MGLDVYVIADGTMPVKEVQVYEIVGLTHSNIIETKGYWCIAATRCANCKFFTYYIEHIVTPFTKTSREHLPAEKQDESLYLVISGEEIQIKLIDDDNLSNSLEKQRSL